VDQLDPVASQAKKYADAVGLINTYTEGATEKTRLLKMAYDTLTPSGIKAAEATRKLVDDAQRVKEAMQTPSERFGADKGSLDAMLGKNLINVETYRRALIQLEAQQNTMWTNMGDVVTQYSDRASESMANFFNGTKTGFSDMISSMLLDMEKMIIKQQIMQPFMNGLSAGLGTMGDGGGWGSWAEAFGSAWGGAHADGGNVYGGQINLVGERGPELFVPHTSGSIIPNSALGGINAPITVIVDANTGGVDVKGGDALPSMQQLGQMMGNKCREVIVNESRSGGLLSRNAR
jgi:phage-related minor tail protein